MPFQTLTDETTPTEIRSFWTPMCTLNVCILGSFMSSTVYLSLTVTLKLTSLPSAASPRSRQRPSRVVSMLPPQIGRTTLKKRSSIIFFLILDLRNNIHTLLDIFSPAFMFLFVFFVFLFFFFTFCPWVREEGLQGWRPDLWLQLPRQLPNQQNKDT